MLNQYRSWFSFLPGDILYIPQYWWHHVYSHGSPNIAINIWFEMFDYEEEFEQANLKEDTDVVKVSICCEKNRVFIMLMLFCTFC